MKLEPHGEKEENGDDVNTGVDGCGEPEAAELYDDSSDHGASNEAGHLGALDEAVRFQEKSPRYNSRHS